MTIEIVDFPMKHGDFPLLCDSSPEGIHFMKSPFDVKSQENGDFMGFIAAIADF